MKIFKCDGSKFSNGEKCNCETEHEDEKGHPEGWLTISGGIFNNQRDRHTITRNGESHFCSWKCLYDILYKDVK